ncbi:DNA polymerase III subunit delta [Ferrovum sp. PN-J185]|uniref:DNA polymerase III subunit delta n=1 Tax=Ferrovum sp. PN-J185 TaxID=1356306 RepID=UPI00079458BE|nr:DNA polymerase III subunit delta [Ferrovum sp. PN-J185]KXW55579.1 DNA polymerase III subunit delta [Ferrovum sp. PN-J185]
MRIDSNELGNHLKKQLLAVNIIHGIEPLLAQEALDLIVQSAKSKGYNVRETYVADTGFDWPSFRANCQSQSLFASQKIIDLRIPTGKPGTTGAEILTELSVSPPPDTIVIISLPKIDYRTQQSKWFDTLQKNGLLIQCNLIERSHLAQWITQRFQQQGQNITPHSAEFIANQVEGNLLAAHQEIQKLRLIFPEGPVLDSDIENAIVDVSRFQVFDLMPALYKRDLIQFERILYGLKAEAEALPLILWALNEETHLLEKTLELKNKGLRFPDIARQLYLKPLHNKFYPSLIEHCSAQLGIKLIHELHHIDRMIKGVKNGDPWHAIANWGLIFVRGFKKT